MKKVDLHVHTNASDGILSPTEVVKLAINKNLRAIAITDHDTLFGIEEAVKAAEEYDNFDVIPGIELSSNYKGEEVHILGYFLNIKDSQLIDKTQKLKDSREKRSQRIVQNLASMGVNITIEEVMKVADKGFIGRPHIARILVEKGYAQSIEEAFNKYIGKDAPAYEERFKLSVVESIDLIHRAGGVAILAHPGLLKNQDLIDEIKEFGFDGIEAIHSKHDEDTTKRFCQIANRSGLITTGGSDCHGVIVGDKPLLGEYYVDYEAINILEERAKERYRG